MRQKLFGMSPAAAPDAAVAEGEGDDAGPMDALDDVGHVAEKKKNLKPAPRRASMGSFEITMPKRPNCAGLDQGQVQTIHILLRPGGNRRW